MEEIKQIRLSNLKTLLSERFGGSQARMADATEREPAQIRSILNPLGIGGRWIGEKIARDIEVKLGLANGWIDVPAYARNTEIDSTTQGRVPLINWIDACNYADIVDNFQLCPAVEWLLTTERIRQHTFALRVQNDSMTPRFPPATILMVEPEEFVHPGDFVVCQIKNDNEATFKQLIKDGSRLYLGSLNPMQYPTLPMNEQTQIIGPVITAITKFKVS